jgi:hypothetical protein
VHVCDLNGAKNVNVFYLVSGTSNIRCVSSKSISIKT